MTDALFRPASPVFSISICSVTQTMIPNFSNAFAMLLAGTERMSDLIDIAGQTPEVTRGSNCKKSKTLMDFIVFEVLVVLDICVCTDVAR